MDFKDQLNSCTRTKEDIEFDKNYQTKEEALEAADCDYFFIKRAILQAASEGNYTYSKSGDRKVVLYAGEDMLYKYVQNSITIDTLSYMILKNIVDEKTTRAGFWRQKVEVNHKCTIVPYDTFFFQCYLNGIKELAKEDSVQITPTVIVTKNGVKEHLLRFPWVYRDLLLDDTDFIVCLKCTVIY